MDKSIIEKIDKAIREYEEKDEHWKSSKEYEFYTLLVEVMGQLKSDSQWKIGMLEQYTEDETYHYLFKTKVDQLEDLPDASVIADELEIDYNEEDIKMSRLSVDSVNDICDIPEIKHENHYGNEPMEKKKMTVKEYVNLFIADRTDLAEWKESHPNGLSLRHIVHSEWTDVEFDFKNDKLIDRTIGIVVDLIDPGNWEEEYPYEEENKKGIRIEATNTLVQGKKKLYIDKVEALKKDNLPEKYLYDGYPFVYMDTIMSIKEKKKRLCIHFEKISDSIAYSKTQHITEGFIEEENTILELIPIIKEAGQRLHDINEEINQWKEEWAGRKRTFVI